MTGFKEVRYVRGRAFDSAASQFTDFEAFLAFLRLMCRDTKVRTA